MTEHAGQDTPTAGAARAVTEARSILRPLRRLARSILDSPVAEADAREVFSGWRIALWVSLLIVSIAIGAFTTAGSYFAGSRPFPLLVAKHGIGALLVAGVQCTTIAFLSLAVPFRASGLLEGPRWRGYFDQLVASGIAPWRYFAGRALVTQALIAIVLLATAPVLAIFWLVDPADLGHVVAGYGLTILYAELLLACSLGLSVLLHEAGAVILTIALAVTLELVAWMPTPSALAALCPTRWVVAPLAPTFIETDTTLVELMYGAPRPFGIEVPYLPYAVGLTLLFSFLAALPCLFGPLYAFLPGFNNFGTVVLPGDRSRAAFRRVRPMLQRRAELAFFFENRGPRLAALAPWARVLQISSFLLLVGTLFIATFANPAIWSQLMGSSINDEDLAMLGPCTLGAVLLLAPFLYATSRNDSHAWLSLGPLRVSVVFGDLIAYALVLGALAAMLIPCITVIAPLTTARRGNPLAEVYAGSCEWVAILCLVGWTALLLTKSIGIRTHARGPSALLAVAGLFATSLVLAAVTPRDLRDRDERARRTDEQNARILTALHVAWPFRMGLALRFEKLDGINLPSKGAWRWLAYNGFWVIYPAFDLAQLAVVASLLRRRRREATEERAAIAKGATT